MQKDTIKIFLIFQVQKVQQQQQALKLQLRFKAMAHSKSSLVVPKFISYLRQITRNFTFNHEKVMLIKL